MKTLLNYYHAAKKAVLGSIVAFIAALVAEVQAGSSLDKKAILLALGTAIVTHATVYSATNQLSGAK